MTETPPVDEERVYILSCKELRRRCAETEDKATQLKYQNQYTEFLGIGLTSLRAVRKI